jgi:hypothetical protein
LVLITEMKAPYMGASPRPVERWVSRQEADRLERAQDAGAPAVAPAAAAPPPSPRAQYETDLMQATHQAAAGDGLYAPFKARYERGDV